MFKKIKGFIAVCLGVFVLLTGLQLNPNLVFAADHVKIKLESHGVKHNVDKPASLLDGQVWSDKSVVDHGDGTFTISLSVATKTFQGAEGEHGALANDTNVIVTDVIGDGFEIVGDVPQQTTFIDNTLTWEIAAKDVANDISQPSQISFKVNYNAEKAGEFVTNERASAEFTPSMNNPYFYDIVDFNVQAKKDFNWKESSVSTSLATTGFLTAVEEAETVVKEEPLEETPVANVLPQTYEDYKVTKAGALSRNATEQSIVERAQNDALVTTKNSTLNPEGTLDIDLEAYVTGSVIAHTDPVDIVLVLDQSGSMGNKIWGKEYEFMNFQIQTFHKDISFVKVKGIYHKLYLDESANEWYYKKGANDTRVYVKQKYGSLTEGYEFYRGDTRQVFKREALKQAVNTFVASLSEDAIANNVNHRIAIVGFGDGQANNYTSTEILSMASGAKNYGNLKREDYSNAFQDANTTIGYDVLMNSVNQVSSESGVLTNTNLGLEMANTILDEASQNDRPKAVIVFTDGAPNDSDNAESSINMEIANKSLGSSYNMKNNKASVYSIGIIDGANPNAPLEDDPKDNVDGQINKFMQLLSSNYLDSGSANMDRKMSSDATNPQNNGYYLTAKSADELSQIFGKIYEEISPSIILNDKSKLIDTISDYFTVTNDTIVDTKTSEYLGKDSDGTLKWDTPVKAEGTNVVITDNKIEVSGFDYSALENVVITRPDSTGGGHKLVISLKNVKPLDGFIGGDKVFTNKSDSGIYDSNGKVVENFDMPTVNVPLKFDFKTEDASIYVGNTWNNVLEFLENENGNVYYLQDGKEYEFGNKKNDFVDVVYTIKQGEKVVGTYKVTSSGNTLTTVNGFQIDTSLLKSDVEKFHITAEVISINDTNNKLNTSLKESSLYIFKPSVDVSDNTIFLGETSKLVDRISSEITWASAANNSASKPKGDVPSLSMKAKEVKDGNEHVDFNQEEALKETTQYKLSLINGTVDITKVATFNNTTAKNDKDATHDFTVYVLKGQLDITKTIDQQYTADEKTNANQSFVYKIEQYKETGELVKTFYQTINFSANALQTSKTVSITGLEKGKYTVSEVSDWSWKYDAGTSSSNCISNDQTLQEIFIGDANANNTSGKPYYGSADGSIIRGEDVSNKAIVKLDAKKKTDASIKNLLGDVASAINEFVK